MFNTATSQANHKLHIPVGIRFECTRCANCCLSWPVPLNEADVKRLVGAFNCSESELPVSFLSPMEKKAGLAGFSRALEKRPDGRCSYLSETACTLQDIAKPAMCQLFPYSFIDTPDGTFVGLSFASTGVLQNSGKLLLEQNEQLAAMLGLFRDLFPDLEKETSEAFNHLNLIDGVSLSYEQFKAIEAPLIADLENAVLASSSSGYAGKSALEILGSFSQSLAQFVPKGTWRNRLPGSDARPRQIDLYILDALGQAYIEPQSKGQLLDDMQIAQSVTSNLLAPAAGFKLRLNGSSFSAVQFLDEKKLGAFDQACENLLLRFVYVRIFSKMYFGPGFSGLSIVAGIGHLIAVLALVRLSAKAKKFDDSFEVNLPWLIDTVRQVDSKLTSARYGANTQAMLEILFLDQERVQRLIDLCA
ncbi:MAG: YkgJ family cysteine cluster protein [Candidatus Obscuribacterales bacterium]